MDANRRKYNSSAIRVGSRAFAVILFAAVLHADTPLPPMLEGVGVDEKVGRSMDLDLTFTAENGYQVPLRTYSRRASR